ncbi:MAG: NAD(P)/FAD-dependent oxidoreductase [Desulfosalsimonas sp.]
MNYVIIGNGVAGVTAAEAIRQIDARGPITMISDETHPPYCRPMISNLLEGAVDVSRLPIRGPDFYDRLSITPVLGSRVSSLDVNARTVTTADGQNHAYDRLLIAAGADPRPLDARGLDLNNIFFMRNIAQVQEMIAAIADTRHALVLGGGLVGFKAAYSLLKRNIAVTMLIRSGYPLSMQVDETAGEMIRQVLCDHGLTVRTGISVTAFEGRGRVQSAHLSDGSQIPCDMAIIGKGVFPAHGFVPADRIARQKRWVNAIWPEAAAQGRVAGFNMAGQALAYRGSLSRNVIRMFDTDVMTAGRVSPRDTDETCRFFSARDFRCGTYRRLVFEDQILVGFVMINQIDQGGVLTSLIQSRTPVKISERHLLDPGFNVSRLFGR